MYSEFSITRCNSQLAADVVALWPITVRYVSNNLNVTQWLAVYEGSNWQGAKIWDATRRKKVKYFRNIVDTNFRNRNPYKLMLVKKSSLFEIFKRTYLRYFNSYSVDSGTKRIFLHNTSKCSGRFVVGDLNSLILAY